MRDIKFISNLIFDQIFCNFLSRIFVNEKNSVGEKCRATFLEKHLTRFNENFISHDIDSGKMRENAIGSSNLFDY